MHNPGLLQGLRACLQGEKRVKDSSGLQAKITGRVTLSPRPFLPALLTCFVLYGKHVKFTKNGKILSSYTENTLDYSDVYNLAQEFFFYK